MLPGSWGSGCVSLQRWRVVVVSVPSALAALVLISLLPGSAAASAKAAPKDTAKVQLTLPNPGELAIARLELKVEGVDKPKPKMKVRKAGELPDDFIAVALAARPDGKKGRSVVIVAAGRTAGPVATSASATESPPALPSSTGWRGEGDPWTILLSYRGEFSGTRVVAGLLENRSGSFVNTFGPELLAVNEDVRKLLGLPPEQFRVDEFGRTTTDHPGLKPTGEPKILHCPSGLFIQGATLCDSPQTVLGSAIASGVGPPATLDAEVWRLVSGQQVPTIIDYVDAVYPDRPNVTFAGTLYSTDVQGRQVSPAGPNPLLLNADTRCAGQNQELGTVSSLAGPGLGQSLLCYLGQPYNTILFDIPTGSPPAPGERIAWSAPFPRYTESVGQNYFGEAIAGPGVSRYIQPVP